MKKPWLIFLACAGMAGAAQAAENCEALRAQIEAKIGAAGVTRFAVVIVDANAPASGQVVGTCGLGSKKIVYQRDAAPAPEAATPAAQPSATPGSSQEGDDILTECKDGTVSIGGTCKR